MPAIYPFKALEFRAENGDLSTLIAPPYDVLDAKGKSKLLEANPSNIVAIDLPHTPAKELGPAAAYENAAVTLQALIAQSVLAQNQTPSIYAYRQTIGSGKAASSRSGMAVCVDAVSFGPRMGGGVLPHEETFSGPKEDRLALMRATNTQLSPIFGLHADEGGAAMRIVRGVIAARPPDFRATMADGVLHEVWRVSDEGVIRAYQAALAGEDIFIADGHHRYSTGLTYLAELEKAGDVPPQHPARKSMMVLVGMSDPGLIIWPTHRVLGAMKHYTIDSFLKLAAEELHIEIVVGDLSKLNSQLEARDDLGEMRFGLFDFATKRGFVARPAQADPLLARFPERPKAWRELVVAYIQYVLVEQLAQPLMNGGEKISWAFPHTIAEVEAIGSGAETGAGGGSGFAQLAVIVRPTPLSAVRDVSRANELMPQKSTFFYPKLATGLFMYPLT